MLFDGVCNLCNATVDFVIRRDRRGAFRFASLQSAAGRALLGKHGLPPDVLDSIVLLDDDGAHTRSTAALRIARRLGGAWPLLYAFIIIPRPFRDLVYDFIGRRRYRWFGKRDTCRVPTPAEHERFID
jgi:predicted DCC family thiol-disulfide oxidoreductase YuxK